MDTSGPSKTMDFSKSYLCNCDNLQHRRHLESVIQECKENMVLMNETVATYVRTIRDDRCSRNALIEIYVNCYPKKSTRRTLLGMIGPEVFVELVERCSGEIQRDVRDVGVFRVQQIVQLLEFISLFLQSVDHVYTYSGLFSLYLCVMEVFSNQLLCCDGRVDKTIETECHTILDYGLKQTLVFCVRSRIEDLGNLEIEMRNYVKCCYTIIKSYSIIRYETVAKCALLMSCVFVRILEVQKDKGKCKWSRYPMLHLIDEASGEECNCRLFEEMEMESLRPIFEVGKMRVVLYAAILNSANVEDLLTLDFGGGSLLEFLYLELIRFGNILTGCPEQIILTARIVSETAEHMGKVRDFSHAFDESLTFVWAHLEHFVESVCHAAKAMLVKLVKWSQVFHTNGNDSFLHNLFRGVNSMSHLSKVRLTALEVITEGLEVDLVLRNFRNLQAYLISLMTDADLGTLSGSVYMSIMERHMALLTQDDRTAMNVWILPVYRVLDRWQNDDDSSALVYQKILLKAFQLRPEVYRDLFPPNQFKMSTQSAILALKCIHLARTKGILLPVEVKEERRDEFWRNCILKRKMELFMVDQSDEVRLCALQAIVESQKSTEEIDEWEILYLLSFFSYNASTQLPSVRRRITGLYKKMFARFQASYHVTTRDLASLDRLRAQTADAGNLAQIDAAHSNLAKVHALYNGFLSQFITAVITNLSCDANFPRRTLSLELLTVVRNVSSPEEWKRCFPPDVVTVLKNLLYDTYEMNKVMALALLESLSPALLGFENERTTKEYLNRCVSLASNVKLSHSVTASYMIRLCLKSPYHPPPAVIRPPPFDQYDFRHQILTILTDKLQKAFEASTTDMFKAVKAVSLHGLLLSLRGMICCRDVKENNVLFRDALTRLVHLCFAITAHVMPVVCAASPEGYLPEHVDSLCPRSDGVIVDESSTAHVILVYAWRTMKEVMLFVAEVVRQTIALQCMRERDGETADADELLEKSVLLEIGNLFIDVFVRCKHRGVFEQAHTAFSIVCQQFSSSRDADIAGMPRKWLQHAIGLCVGVESNDLLCSTRRSAGLPFLILSILSTVTWPQVTHHSKHLFRQTMDALLSAAVDPHPDEIRSHSLNVLRFIFNNAKLADLLPNFISQATIAALAGFQSRAWGVRNSSTLLYSTLMTRIFGVQRTQDSCELLSSKNRMTLAVFHVRHPALFDFLHATLSERPDRVESSLILHPILLILARLYPSHNDRINDRIEGLIRCVGMCMASPSFRTRDLAARASVSLIPAKLMGRCLMENFSRIGEGTIGDTECHGLLLQIWYLVKNHKSPGGDKLAVMECVAKSLNLMDQLGTKSSHMTIGLYMKVLTLLLLKFDDDTNDFAVLARILKQLPPKMAAATTDNTCKVNFNWDRFQLLFLILIKKVPRLQPSNINFGYALITREILENLYGRDPAIRNNTLLLLIYLNRSQCNRASATQHPLFTSGDLEVPRQIRDVVDSAGDEVIFQLLATHVDPFLNCFLYGRFIANFADDDRPPSCHRKTGEVLMFLLLRFYPGIFGYKRRESNAHIHYGDSQETLNVFVEVCRRNEAHEEIISAVVSCLCVFVLTLTENQCISLNFCEVIKVLMESASPAAADHRRLVAANFLVNTRHLHRFPFMSEINRFNILNTIMVLLEDEELLVRNTMSLYPVSKDKNAKTLALIPEKARTDLLLSSLKLLSNEVSVGFLTSWAIRYLPAAQSDSSELFERGELNQYAENFPVTHATCKVLDGLLWPLGEDLNYQDKSIFQEEQALLVSTVVLNALMKVPSPCMNKFTKTSVVCALKCIIKFLEDGSVGAKDFSANLTEFLSIKLFKYLKTCLGGGNDFSSVKYFFILLYRPVLKGRFYIGGKEKFSLAE